MIEKAVTYAGGVLLACFVAYYIGHTLHQIDAALLTRWQAVAQVATP